MVTKWCTTYRYCESNFILQRCYVKKHLAGGVTKGALTEEQAEAKFNAWLEEKAAKVQAKTDGLSKAEADAKAKALDAEKAVNEARIAAAAPVELLKN